MTWTSYPIQLCNQVFHPFVIWWKECMWLCFLDLGSTMYVVQFHQLHVAGFFNSLPPWAKRVWSQAVMVTSVECGVLFCFCFFGHVFGAILVYLFDKAIWRGSVAITQTEKKKVLCLVCGCIMLKVWKWQKYCDQHEQQWTEWLQMCNFSSALISCGCKMG